MFRLFLVLFLVLFGSFSYAQDLDLDIAYDDVTGHIQVATNLTDHFASIRLVSTTGIFTGELARGIYDQHQHLVYFPRGKFLGPNMDLGLIASPGLSLEFLASDLCVDASDDIRSLTLMGQAQPVTNQRCDVPPNPTLPVGDGEKTVVFYYDNSSGNLFVDVGENSWLTTLEITSPAGIFTGDPAENLAHPFDVDSDHKIFKMFGSGFGDIDFGNVASQGLSNNEFLNSICVEGSWYGGGAIEAEFQYPGTGRVPMAKRAGRGRCQGQDVSTDVDLAYDPESGHFAVSVDRLLEGIGGGGGGKAFAVLQINSESGVFVGVPNDLDGPDDVFSPNAIIKHDPNGFSQLELSEAIMPGLDLEFLLSDLSIDAILTDNSSLGEVRFVPEPSSLAGLSFVSVCIGIRCRRRKNPLPNC